MTDNRPALTNDWIPPVNGLGHSPFVPPGGVTYTADMGFDDHRLSRIFRRYRLVRHVAYWVVPFLGFLLLVRAFESTQTAVEVALSIFMPAPLTAYSHYFVLKRFFEKRRYWLYGGSVVVIVAVSSLLTDVVHGLVVQDATSHTSGVGTAVLVILLSTGLHYFSRGLSQQVRLQEAEARHLAAELALLRTQIHPHFLFNTLNGLYALALERSERMPSVVLQLSELLRYVLDSGERDRVPLADEIRFLENYVALERLRNDRDVDLHLEIRGTPAGREVAPMLLAPFVENAFKHGDLGLRPEALIHMRLDMEERHWRFTVANTWSGQQSPERSGIGLASVRRRLELLHPGAHSLETRSSEDRYEIELVVQS
ncbi:MAG: hypothetical protein GY838_14270 [bacterium]|nr:hypothetical protein [bacterium]